MFKQFLFALKCQGIPVLMHKSNGPVRRKVQQTKGSVALAVGCLLFWKLT